MKKKKFLVMIMCTFLMFAGVFCGVKTSAYAYTDEEIQMAKDWLSANGYSPTRAGAEQAYQDYLNGLVDPFGNGNKKEEQPEIPATEVPQETPVENIAEAATVVPVIEKPTETVTETSTPDYTETETETASSEEAQSESESVIATENVEKVTEEQETVESTPEEITSEAIKEDGSFITNSPMYIVIAVVCVIVCAVMIYFVVRYIKKDTLNTNP